MSCSQTQNAKFIECCTLIDRTGALSSVVPSAAPVATDHALYMAHLLRGNGVMAKNVRCLP